MLTLPPVIGHRGAAGLAPENTLASFDLAADLGCAMVEFDVRLSADQVAVVFHDDTLERCTGASGPVASRTAHDLQALNIPTLAQVLELCLRRNLLVNIEIKPDRGTEVATARAALETAGAQWPSDRVPPLVSSFRRPALAVAREVAPHWPRGLLYGRLPQGWRRHAEVFDCFSWTSVGSVRIGSANCTMPGFRCWPIRSIDRAGRKSFGIAGFRRYFPTAPTCLRRCLLQMS